MNGSIRIGNLFDIPLFINYSWFFVLGLVTLNYAGGLALRFPHLPTGETWLLGLVAALLLFASVLAHELGHSFAARLQGIRVHSITLFLFGGLANLEKEAETPAGSFWVAIAGPLVSLGLFGLLTGTLLTTPVSGPLVAIVGLLASVNLALAVFNMIPGLPLDGGNVLKALVWKITGNPYKGVLFASRVGQGLGWLAIAIGGLSFLGITRFGSFWTLLIGWFLLQNAGRSAQSATVQEQLQRYTVADAVTPNSPVVQAQLSLREFADTLILNAPQWRQFLVVDESEQLLGSVAVEDLKQVPSAQWPETQVRDIVRRDRKLITVQPDQTLLEIWDRLAPMQSDGLAVVRTNGTLVGLLEKSSIQRLLNQPRLKSA
jgi:Zn-dependent protease